MSSTALNFVVCRYLDAVVSQRWVWLLELARAGCIFKLKWKCHQSQVMFRDQKHITVASTHEA